MPAGAVLSFRNLSLRFGPAVALDRICLEIGAGELLAVAGPSGCGKTTLLRCLAGLEAADEGTVLRDGADLSGVPPHRRGMAMVFQEHALVPHWTAEENIALGCRDRPAVERRARVRDAAERLAIASLLERRPDALSGGERQRVAVARALASGSPVLLFDEPFASLDEPFRHALRADFKRLQREIGFTCLFVTHDRAEALELGDRLALMRGGALVHLGPPSRLHDDPDDFFAASFLSRPALTRLEGSVRDGAFLVGGAALPLSALPRLPAQPDAVAVLGLRPCSVSLHPPGEAGIAGRVESLTWDGLGTLLSLQVGGLRLPAVGNLPVGAACSLTIRAAGAFWFDAGGVRLR